MSCGLSVTHRPAIIAAIIEIPDSMILIPRRMRAHGMCGGSGREKEGGSQSSWANLLARNFNWNVGLDRKTLTWTWTRIRWKMTALSRGK